MDFVAVNIFCLHRQERSSTNMEGHENGPDVCRFDAPDKLRRKMEPRRWRSDSARFLRVGGLIIVEIAFVGRARSGYVGRKRHRAVSFHYSLNRLAYSLESDFAARSPPRDEESRPPALTLYVDNIARPQTPGRPGKSMPRTVWEAFKKCERYLDRWCVLLACLTNPMERSRKHLRIVEDDDIPGPKEARKISHLGLGKRRIRIRSH
jgi:hypothetical protein